MEELCKPKIKICGLRTTEDARLLNEAGADYAGFVFHPSSRRNLRSEEAREIMLALDPAIRRVAVCVSPSAECIREIQALPFDLLQVHGSLSAESLDAIRLPLWRAVNLSGIGELEECADEAGMERVRGILIDAKDYGSGRTFDWNAAEQIRTAVRGLCAQIDALRSRRQGAPKSDQDASSGAASKTLFILAGGLNAANAAEGIRLFAPDAVDVSSGVEYDPSCGRIGKDPEKLRSFFRVVRG